MGGFGAYQVCGSRFCADGRKALAAFAEPGLVLVCIVVRAARCNPIKEISVFLKQWPEPQYQWNCHRYDDNRERQAHMPVVPEPVASRPHHQGVGLVADRGQESA